MFKKNNHFKKTKYDSTPVPWWPENIEDKRISFVVWFQPISLKSYLSLVLTDMSQRRKTTPLWVTCELFHVPANESVDCENMKMLLNYFECSKHSDWPKHVISLYIYICIHDIRSRTMWTVMEFLQISKTAIYQQRWACEWSNSNQCGFKHILTA